MLRKLTNSWHEAKLIRGFIENLSAASEDNNLTPEVRRDARALVDWATNYVDSIDPFKYLVEAVHYFKGTSK